MITIFNVPTRNLNDASLSSGLVNLSQLVDVANCGGLLLRYDILSISSGGSLTLTYAIYVNGEFRSGATAVITTTGPGDIGFDVGGKNDTTQLQADLRTVGRVRLSATLYSTAPGEDIV